MSGKLGLAAGSYKMGIPSEYMSGARGARVRRGPRGPEMRPLGVYKGQRWPPRHGRPAINFSHPSHPSSDLLRWHSRPHTFDSIPPLRVVGMALFYPLLDLTISRRRKRLTCTRPDLTLSKSLTDLFDASYLHPPIPRTERNDPRLSPGLMPEEWIDRLPPVHLCLCEYDMLLAEGVRFGERLKGRDKRVSVRIVAGEKHGWDKRPARRPKRSVLVEYDEAVKEMEDWVERANKPTLLSQAKGIVGQR